MWISTWWNVFSIYHPTCLIMILAPAVLANDSPRTCIYSKSQHKTTMPDLNWYMATTHLVIILKDNAIKHTCIWPLAWHNKYKPYNSSTPLQQFLTFHSPVKEKGKQWRMKGFTMPQLMNLNWNNTTVLAHQYSILWEKLTLSTYC